MRKILIIASFIIFGIPSVLGQMLRYEVVRGSKKLGSMDVERTFSYNTVGYHTKSKVVFKLLFSFKVDYELHASYENGVLFREKTVSKLNGSVQKQSDIVKKGDSYSLMRNGSKSTQPGPIHYSVAAIYFQEPFDGQKVFSPQFGQYLVFKKIGAHQYQMGSPDGVNVYTYLNGICTEVKVVRDYAKFYFRMDAETLHEVRNKADSLTGNN